jgi:hypothetical protein
MNSTAYETARATADLTFLYIWNAKLREMSTIFARNIIGQLEVNSTD